MNKKHQSGVFMMEMTAVVFFFILCAAICIQTFVKADVLSRRALDLNQGVFIAQSVAEVFKAEGQEGLQKQLRAKGEAGKPVWMGFDDFGNPCEVETAVFRVRADFFESGQVELTVVRGEEEVYVLHAFRWEA